MGMQAYTRRNLEISGSEILATTNKGADSLRTLNTWGVLAPFFVAFWGLKRQKKRPRRQRGLYWKYWNNTL